jgi:hypothetical protein
VFCPFNGSNLPDDYGDDDLEIKVVRFKREAVPGDRSRR